MALREALDPAGADDAAAADPASRLSLRPAIALALLSAALTAVIFLVVLLLVAGWSIDPLAAALAVSVLPVSAVAASRIPGDSETRAVTGCLLVAGGIGCLALLPAASAWWTVVPQVLAGAGMGLALPALAGELLPEVSRRDVARVLAIRHAGIALALAVLAPIVSAQLDDTVKQAREEGTAALLDAELRPQTKIEVAPELFARDRQAGPARPARALVRRRARRASTATSARSSTASRGSSTTSSPAPCARPSGSRSSSPPPSRSPPRWS